MGLSLPAKIWALGSVAAGPTALTAGAEPRRLAVPGVVWGTYPQAGEPMTQGPRRKRLHLSPRQIATQAAAQQDRPLSVTQIRQLLAAHGISNASCVQALACIAQLVQTSTGLRPHPPQLEAAAAMLNQELVEMATGEGKSIAAAMAAALAALTGCPVHLMTSNDYLAARDAINFKNFFETLGLSVGSSLASMELSARQRAYQQSVCYSTAKTIAFDYLRDQRILIGEVPQAEYVQSTGLATLLKGLCFAIVDEADSVLIDEASMPLVLAEQQSDPSARARLWQAVDLARKLVNNQDFVIEPRQRKIRLRPTGQQRIAELAENYSNEWLNARYRRELVTEALTALHVLKHAVDYIISDAEIVLIDSTTGRPAPGRQLPGQLHGLLAISQNLQPPSPTRTGSGLTYPRFFARYHHLTGLSATLAEARRELNSLYGLPVRRVARHQRWLGVDLGCRVFKSRDDQFDAAVGRAIELSTYGRPVLLGTDSVRDSEYLAQRFKRKGRPVNVLHAANDAQEASRVACSGRAGQITISTQMAGRGTDISPDQGALAAGGLHVVNLQHNRSPRIDRQLHGRAARQGNPGSFEHWLRLSDSPLGNGQLTDPIATIFGLLQRIGWNRGAVGLAQYIWQMEDRSERVSRLRSDRQGSLRLHFSSMSNR